MTVLTADSSQLIAARSLLPGCPEGAALLLVVLRESTLGPALDLDGAVPQQGRYGTDSGPDRKEGSAHDTGGQGEGEHDFVVLVPDRDPAGVALPDQAAEGVSLNLYWFHLNWPLGFTLLLFSCLGVVFGLMMGWLFWTWPANKQKTYCGFRSAGKGIVACAAEQRGQNSYFKERTAQGPGYHKPGNGH